MKLLKTQLQTLRAIDAALHFPNLAVLAKRLNIPLSSAGTRVRTLIRQRRVERVGNIIRLTELGLLELEKEKE